MSLKSRILSYTEHFTNGVLSRHCIAEKCSCSSSYVAYVFWECGIKGGTQYDHLLYLVRNNPDITEEQLKEKLRSERSYFRKLIKRARESGIKIRCDTSRKYLSVLDFAEAYAKDEVSAKDIQKQTGACLSFVYQTMVSADITKKSKGKRK